MARGPAKTTRAFVERINAHDAKGVAALSAPLLRFVDASGGTYKIGAEGWDAYFSDFPDYHIEIEDILTDSSTVAVFGSASGSFRGKARTDPGARWTFPAAWKAIVRDGRVVEWRVYADIEPMLRSAGQGRSK